MDRETAETGALMIEHLCQSAWRCLRVPVHADTGYSGELACSVCHRRWYLTCNEMKEPPIPDQEAA